MYKLLSPRFTESLANKAICEVRYKEAIYALKFRRGVELVSFKSSSLGCSIFMLSYFQDFRTNCLNGSLFVLFRAWLILSKILGFPLYPSSRVDGF